MSEPSAREIRIRCVEAAARNPVPHKDGFAAGVLEQAKVFSAWVLTGESADKAESVAKVDALL